MPDAEQRARRRDLQRRAFAPGGGLNPAEADELQRLNEEVAGWSRHGGAHQRVVEPGEATVQATSGPSTSSGTHHGGDHSWVAQPVEATSGEATSGPSTSSGTQPETSATEVTAKRRRLLLPVALAVAALIGFGGGMYMATRPPGPLQMSSAQRDALTALESSDDYDPGSILVHGEKYGVTVWEATREAAAQRCIILVHGEDQAADCRLVEDIQNQPPSTNLELVDDGERVMIWAFMTDDIGGERTVIVQRHTVDGGNGWQDQYSPEELAIVGVLQDAGYSGASLSIVGHDGDTPIWVSESSDTCLIVADSTRILGQECTDILYDTGESLDLTVDGTTYSLQSSTRRGNQLTIIRGDAPSDGVCDPDSGECAVDDKTGETR